MENRRPRSSQTVSVSWGEDQPASTAPAKHLALEISECVETRTVTTTTTTKRTYPPVFVREPRSLESLDAREYPLALKPTPPELISISFDVPTEQDELLEQSDGGFMKIEPTSPLDAVANRRTRSSSLRDSQNTSASATRRASQRQTASLNGLRRSIAHTNRNAAERTRASSFLATPDATEMAVGSRDPFQNMPDPASRSVSYDSPTSSDFHTGFSGSVATPPVDMDQELADPDESLQDAIRISQQRPSIDIVAAQDASLPSPRLSPTLASAHVQSSRSRHRLGDDDDDSQTHSNTLSADSSGWMDDSQTADEGDSLGLIHTPSRRDPSRSVGLNTMSMIENFDSMPEQMKAFMMFQLLRRCNRNTLRVVANIINPELKCDFLQQLPLELSYQVLSYLDHRDLCHGAQVSKHWRTIIDSNETGWKDLFDRDGFQLAPGELERAIEQGWGWQDPEGPLGYEMDLSSLSVPAIKAESKPETRSRGKRKRNAISAGPAERAKRRASAQEPARLDRAVVKLNRSEGPISAANAAAAAIPDPSPILDTPFPSLRKMHLFKSLYRRHYMIRQSWTSGDVRPGHLAFAAHPQHVITCLQFDEDKIITGSDDQFIHIYDTKTGFLRKKLQGHDGGVWALQYEGNTLVSGSTDRTVRVWDIEKGICNQIFYGHTSTVRCLQILMPSDTGKRDADNKPIMQPEKPLIITGSRDHQLRIWDLPRPGERSWVQANPNVTGLDCPYFVRTLAGHGNSVRAISAHGDTLVSGSYDATVRVWRISTGEEIHVLTGHTQKVYSVVLDHERNRCISGSMDSLVKIWDLITGECLYTLDGHSLLVGLLDLRDQRLVSAAADSTLRVWDPENGKCKSVLMAHTGAITCFQHDGRKVISGSDKTVKMWDVGSGQCLQDLLTDLSGVWQVKFNHRRCVAAVQRDNITYVEILDFGAVRDGVPQSELGVRRVLNEDEVQRLRDEQQE